MNLLLKCTLSFNIVFLCTSVHASLVVQLLSTSKPSSVMARRVRMISRHLAPQQTRLLFTANNNNTNGTSSQDNASEAQEKATSTERIEHRYWHFSTEPKEIYYPRGKNDELLTGTKHVASQLLSFYKATQAMSEKDQKALYEALMEREAAQSTQSVKPGLAEQGATHAETLTHKK